MKVQDKNFIVEKIEKYLKEDIVPSRYRQQFSIENWKYFETTMDEKIDDAYSVDYDDSQWQDFKLWDTWGGYDKVAWFRTTIEVPQSMRGKSLALHLLVGPRDGGGSTAEALLYLNGQSIQGVDIWHDEVVLEEQICQESNYCLALKAWSGVLEAPKFRTFKVAELVELDKTVDEFCFIVQTLLECVKQLDENDLRRIRLIKLLNQTFKKINFLNYGEEDYYQSLYEAHQFVKNELEELYKVEEIKPIVYGVGHAHIDMAWLWRLNATREKASRTFSTVLNLMKQYPEYKFMHSSPQLYEFLKEDYPEIYAQIKEKIAEGNWEITGGMWIEPDTNIPSGESLVRQFVYGKKFIKDEFDKETTLVWLPDVFGYSAALPQIMKKSGMKYFMTTKISWNQYNHFPYDTFMWKGIDGSEIFTHFITTPEEDSWFYTYNGHMSPEEVSGIWDSYKDKDKNEELLIAYGWGDGGGGPTREMLEQTRVMKNIPGIPQAKTSGAEEYFEKIYQNTNHEELGKWDGELYFELHRGTYTSQAANKWFNRKTENLLHDLEFLAATTALQKADYEYPKAELDKMWKRTLLHQFHDILPGSSIRQVYEDTTKDYLEIEAAGNDLLHDVKAFRTDMVSCQNDSLVIYNTTGIKRDDHVFLPYTEKITADTAFSDEQGMLGTQYLTDGVLIFVKDIPAFGFKTIKIEAQDLSEAKASTTATVNSVETPYYQIEFNQNGEIIHLYDKENQRVVSTDQPMNQFIAYEDKPQRFDAWDIDVYYKEKPYQPFKLINSNVVENGTLRTVINFQWKMNKSTISQNVVFYANSRRIDFETEVDWQEKQVFLKTYFPVDIHSNEATYEIQFGNIKRPTHTNTEWDFARFEVSGHRWADLSETGYGVSVLNDSKYGWDIHENVIGLSLIKSAIHPDETADRKEHRFTYSLYPHAGDLWKAKTQEEALKLNLPLLSDIVSGNEKSTTMYTSDSFVWTNHDNLMIDTIKRSEDGQGIIVRLYEFQNQPLDQAKLFFGRDVKKVIETDLCETGDQEIDLTEHRIMFPIGSYEIKTFKLFF